MITRRSTLAGLGSLGLVGSMIPVLARADVNLGDISVTTLSDGHLVMPGAFFFDGLPQDEVKEILAQHNLPSDQMKPPCNVTMMQDGDKTILFDVGSGPAFMPTAGSLLDSLEATGVAPEDVTHVVFTHAHPDHLWGVLDDFDDPVFPEAQYMMGQAEWDYWSDPDTVNTIGEARASFAAGAARRLAAIEDRCTMFLDGQEVLPGILAHASFGHTPGHMSFEVRGGTQSLMVIGDAIGNAHVAMARPEWPSGADQDADLGATTRTRLLDQMAQDQMLVIGFHLPDGGIGRVERADTNYRFVPEGM